MALIPFQNPTTMILSGCTGSGKTTWLMKLLKHKDEMFESKIEHIFYHYGVWQDVFQELEQKQGVHFYHGLPSSSSDYPKHSLIILDDLQDQVVNCKLVEQFFTRGSHHNEWTVIYLTQNLFYQGKCSRNIALNAHYTVLFKNPRDIQQIAFLGRQLGNTELIKEAYKDATTPPYGYLVIDLSPHSSSEYRYRTHVFPGEYPIVYKE